MLDNKEIAQELALHCAKKYISNSDSIDAEKIIKIYSDKYKSILEELNSKRDDITNKQQIHY